MGIGGIVGGGRESTGHSDSGWRVESECSMYDDGIYAWHIYAQSATVAPEHIFSHAGVEVV